MIDPKSPARIDPLKRPGPPIGFGTTVTFIIALLFFGSLAAIGFTPERLIEVPAGVARVLSFFWPADMAYGWDRVLPAIVESIRAGLVFGLKQAVGTEVIRAHEDDYVSRAIEAWSGEPGIEVLGNTDAERLSIVSFVIRHGERHLHHNFVVAVLNDVFGIQSRGGCSCAGPYGHRLLGIDLDRSHEFQREINRGCEGIKPGWVRVNFNYFIAEQVFDFVVRAVAFVARYGQRFLVDYDFDPTTGIWRHRAGPGEPPLRLTEVGYDADGRLCYPHHDERAPVSVLADYLAHAESLAAQRAADDADDRGGLSDDFEALRWFELPGVSVRHR